MNKDFFKDKKILVTGGASFIGSHLVDALISLNTNVRVVDDLSSGKLENIKQYVDKKKVHFIKGDLRETKVAKQAVRGIDLIFHLAGDHGGRGYVDTHQAGPSINLLLSGNVFWQAYNAGVEKIVFASSGCVYPNYLQKNHKERLFLKEKQVGPPFEPDNMYGWDKLSSELTLSSYVKELGLKAVSCRFFTVYGPRGKEDHAITAMIARAFIKQDPFIVWGNGKQVRNWTYVEDVVKGVLLSAEKIDDGSAVNLGTMERVRVMEAVKLILEYTGHKAKIELMPTMPTGPVNRVADNSLAKKILGWKPETTFKEGVKKTIEWYFENKDPKKVARILDTALFERNLLQRVPKKSNKKYKRIATGAYKVFSVVE